MSGKEINRDEVVKHIADVDPRLLSEITIERREVEKFYPKSGFAYVSRDIYELMVTGNYRAELTIRRKK